MPWYIRKRPNLPHRVRGQGLPFGRHDHNEYKVYGENGNPLSKEWKTRYEAEKQLKAVLRHYVAH